MTLKVIRLMQDLSHAIRRTFLRQLFLGEVAIAELPVFSASEVTTLWRYTIITAKERNRTVLSSRWQDVIGVACSRGPSAAAELVKAVLTATGFVNGIKFDPPAQNPHPSTHHQKFVAGDYLRQIFGDGLKGVDFVGGGSNFVLSDTDTGPWLSIAR